MSSAASEVRFVVILESDRRPPHGRVLADGEPNRPFTGWLGLLSALEAASDGVLGHRSADEPSDDSSGDT